MDNISGINNEFDVDSRYEHHVAGSDHLDMLTGFVRGEGVWLFDEKGRKYLDCYSKLASVGHHNPAVTKVIREKASQVIISPYGIDEHVVNYAERLASSLPGELSICFFAYTETQAIALAMHIAQTLTQKSGFIVTENPGDRISPHRGEHLTERCPEKECTPQTIAVEPPNLYRPPFIEADTSERYIQMINDAINTLNAKGSGVAAFMCDSIFSAEGYLEAPEDYFKCAYNKIRAEGGLCIADETQAGLGRTGFMWGFEHYHVIPDIVISGQSTWPGLPMSVVVTTAAIGEAFQRSGGHFNNYKNHALSAVVESAALTEIEAQSLLENVKTVGRYLRAEFKYLAARHALIGNIRGLGFAFGVELVTDRHSKRPAREEARAVVELMRTEGVLIDAAGRHGNVLTIRLPLVFSKDNCDFMTEKLDKVLTRITADMADTRVKPSGQKAPWASSSSATFF